MLKINIFFNIRLYIRNNFIKKLNLCSDKAIIIVFFTIIIGYSSIISNSITLQADFATEVPGPKIAITPALYKKS